MTRPQRVTIPKRQRHSRIKIALHLGYDIRRRGKTLYCHWRSGNDVSRRCCKAGAKPEAFFKSDEQHIRSLAWDAKGNLIAGSDGSGLRLSHQPAGQGIRSLRGSTTRDHVGCGGCERNYLRCQRWRQEPQSAASAACTGVGTVTFTIVQPGSLQAVNASTSAPEGTEIYALNEGQAPRKIWSGKDEIVYAMAARPDGLLALSGNRGHMFRIQENGDYADVAHVDAQQGLSFAVGNESKGGLLIGTGNTGRLYSLSAIDKHEYASDVLDAGSLSRFGRVEVDPDSASYELFTRTGNVEQPVRGRNDWGWSDWQPLKDGTVASPPGRFLQWKAVLRAGGRVGSVGVNYLPVNAAPVIDDLVVATGARLNPQNVAANPQQIVNITFSGGSQGGAPPPIRTATRHCRR